MKYSAMVRACTAPWGMYTRACMTVLTLLVCDCVYYTRSRVGGDHMDHVSHDMWYHSIISLRE